MIRNIFLSVAFIAFAITGLNAQDNDTLYIMKSGNVVSKYNVNTEIDSVIFYHPQTESNDTMYIIKEGNIVNKYHANNQVDSIIFYKPQINENTFVDERDGNVYHYVEIGNQTWMSENLRYLPSVDSSINSSPVIPFYFVHGYEGEDVEEAMATENYQEYGVLYNWIAATGGNNSSASPSGLQGVCPEGWHLPSNAEWDTLINFVGGGLEEAGGKLKETGTTHWNAPNTGATDEFGFKALPAGQKFFFGNYGDLGDYTYFWSASVPDGNNADGWVIFLRHDRAKIAANYYTKALGFSVRCVKD